MPHLRHRRTGASALGLAASLIGLCCGLAAPAAQAADVLVVGIDRKFAYDADGRRQALPPGRDEILVFDLADPAAPRLQGALPLENSVVLWRAREAFLATLDACSLKDCAAPATGGSAFARPQA